MNYELDLITKQPTTNNLQLPNNQSTKLPIYKKFPKGKGPAHCCYWAFSAGYSWRFFCFARESLPQVGIVAAGMFQPVAAHPGRRRSGAGARGRGGDVDDVVGAGKDVDNGSGGPEKGGLGGTFVSRHLRVLLFGER